MLAPLAPLGAAEKPKGRNEQGGVGCEDRDEARRQEARAGIDAVGFAAEVQIAHHLLVAEARANGIVRVRDIVRFRVAPCAAGHYPQHASSPIGFGAA